MKNFFRVKKKCAELIGWIVRSEIWKIRKERNSLRNRNFFAKNAFIRNVSFCEKSALAYFQQRNKFWLFSLLKTRFCNKAKNRSSINEFYARLHPNSWLFARDYNCRASFLQKLVSTSCPLLRRKFKGCVLFSATIVIVGILDARFGDDCIFCFLICKKKICWRLVVCGERFGEVFYAVVMGLNWFKFL